LGNEEEHFSFKVAASARPMIAGERARPAAVAVDDLMNVRRLMGAIFIMLPPRSFLYFIAIFAAARLQRL
jgi:hypothetical protein